MPILLPLCSLLFLLFLATAPAPLHASEPLSVELQGCAEIDAQVFERFVRVETGRLTIVADASTLSAAESDVRILVRCLPKGAVELLLVPKGARPSKKRTLLLPASEQPEWALAQAVAELLEEQSRASIKVKGAAPPLREEVVDVKAQEKSPAEEPPSESDVSISVMGDTVWFGGLGAGFGTGLEGERVWQGQWMAATGLHVLWGDAMPQPGELSYLVSHMDFTLGVCTGQRLRTSLGVGLKAGWVAWEAEDTGKQEGSPWAGAFTRAKGAWKLGQSYGVNASVEAGVPVVEALVTQGGEDVAGIRGWWLAGAVGITWFL